MNNPPVSPTDAEILETIQCHWDLDLDAVAYFPAGFGAHHWQGSHNGAPTAFITLDQPGDDDQLRDLEGAYAAAYQLAVEGLAFVIAPLPTLGGAFTSPLSDGVVSVTPWTQGETPTAEAAAESEHLERTIQTLRQLHACSWPESLPLWRPRVAADFADQLRMFLADPWANGPQGEQAHRLISSHIDAIERINSRYHALASIAVPNSHLWVPTHGEPHFANQMLVDGDLTFVDWETLRLAPKERDVFGIPAAGRSAFDPDPDMIELFSLEWTLCEIDEYATWFRGLHTGNQDDVDALAKLQQELDSIHS